MRRAVLFGGAEIGDYPPIGARISPDDLIICADAGIRHASALGLTADVWGGDFDSVRPEDAAAARYREKITLPREKDDTDLLWAARTALERGCREALLFGASGSRLDHTYANFFLLRFLAEHGASGVLIDAHNEVRLHTGGRMELPARAGAVLSVLPFGGPARGVTLRGVKYPLSDAELSLSFPIGVSNEITGACAEIELKEGNLLLFLSRD